MEAESNPKGRAKLYAQFLFDITADIPPEDVMLKLDDENGMKVNVITRQGITTITGQAKSRKTVMAVILMSQLINTNGKIKILHVDTEQSAMYLKKTVLRLYSLMGWDTVNMENYRVLTLCDCPVKERKRVTEAAIADFRPDFALIDGVRDLVMNINDPCEATETVQWEQHIVKHYDMHLCNVIHQNKNDQNVRGHVGSELVNKSESIFEVTKTLEMSKVAPLNGMARAKPFKPFAFKMDDDGLPYICEADDADAPERNPAKYEDIKAFVEKSILAVKNRFMLQTELIKILENNRSFGVKKGMSLRYIHRMLDNGFLVKEGKRGKTELSLADKEKQRTDNICPF